MVKEDLYADLIDPRVPLSNINLSPITPNRRSIGSMKKYYQIILITVAILSLVSLLVYRHEYNKLRYVLEVLNFYGKPGMKDADPRCTTDNLALERQFSSPLPSWQRLNDELFVYSAYRVRKNEIRAIAFGKFQEKLNLNCKVFFDGPAPVLGTFTHMKINRDSEYAGYQLICKYSGIAIPEGVAFFSKETGGEKKARILNVKNSSNSLMSNGIALCVAPPMNRSILRTDMISFINYHNVVGVREFVVYDYEIPTRFTNDVKDIIFSENLNISLTILPWNFPFAEIPSDVVKGVVETDCLYRTYYEVEYSATLYWEEYLVLKYRYNLLDVLKDYEKTIMTSERYFIGSSVFCTQQTNNELTVDTAAPTIFRKTSKVLETGGVKTRNVYISKPHECLDLDNADPAKPDTDWISVNHYRYCLDTKNELSYTKDESILKFVDYMLQAPIYKEYIAKKALSRK